VPSEALVRSAGMENQCSSTIPTLPFLGRLANGDEIALRTPFHRFHRFTPGDDCAKRTSASACNATKYSTVQYSTVQYSTVVAKDIERPFFPLCSAFLRVRTQPPRDEHEHPRPSSMTPRFGIVLLHLQTCHQATVLLHHTRKTYAALLLSSRPGYASIVQIIIIIIIIMLPQIMARP